MKTYLKIFLAMAVIFSQVSCSNDDDGGEFEAKETSRVMVSLTDAPGDYDHVYVDVEDVRVMYANDETEVSIGGIEAGVYDLLELTGGVKALLTDEDIEAGQISQIRLVLGDNNSIVVDGETHDLQTPSAQQSGLKINVNQTLEADVVYEFTLDFDVEESIVVQGNGNYLLKPVLRASLASEVGTVSATILPTGFQALVTADNGSETISAYTDSMGKVVLHGVPEGTYTVTIEPEIGAGFEIMTLVDVEVLQGQVTALGELELQLL